MDPMPGDSNMQGNPLAADPNDDHHHHGEDRGDIEKNIPLSDSHHGSSPSTSSSSNSMDSIPNDDDTSFAANNPSITTSMCGTACFAVAMIIMIILFPFALIASTCVLLYLSLFGESISKMPISKLSVYHKMEGFMSKKELKTIIAGRLAGLRCISALWLLLNLCIPRLRRALLFGSLLWKWSLLPILFFFGFIIAFATVVYFGFPFDIYKVGKLTIYTPSYYTVGLTPSVSWVLYLTGLLLAWKLYFGTGEGLGPSPLVDKHIVWALVSLLLGSILWVLKNLVLLNWKAKAILKRFEERILMAGFNLFFLSKIIAGDLSWEFLLPWRAPPYYNYKNRGNTPQKIISNTVVPLAEIMEVAQGLVDLARVTLRENDDISDIIIKYQRKIRANNNENEEKVTKEVIQKWTNKEELAELLIAQLQEEFPSKPIEEVPFLKWMVGAHKNCLSLGYTLIDAFAVAKVLNTVLSCCLVGVVTLFWLIATGLATTKVLVVIATPFLAITFVFGDTCKTLFQGVIFSFVTHPFDVGDRCIIDEVEVEVQRIGIMMTTCFKIGTNERLLYPTSILATKLILNLESKPDPTDAIELVLNSSTKKSQIVRLQKRIRGFLGNDAQRAYYEKSCRVIVKEIGSSIKMSVHFKHTLNVRDVSHSQFAAKKNRGRSKFLIKIKKFMEELKVTVPAS